MTKHWAAVVIVCYLTAELSRPDPIMGPGKIIVKHAEKCPTGDPVFESGTFRYYKKGDKVVLQTNLSVPSGVSDDIGYVVNIAIKRNGGWKPNFMKFQGKGLCSGVKAADPEFFKVMAKMFEAPPKCPIPPGTLAMNYTNLDATRMVAASGLSVMPYGDFRISANVTHKDVVTCCFRFYVELAPKNKRG